MDSNKPLQKFLFKLALGTWLVLTLIRYWRVELFAGLSFDDAAFAASGRDLLTEGHSYWGDALHPFASWWVAFFHKLFGISIVNVGMAFATMRSFGELFLILTARRLFPFQPWAPLTVVAVSGSSFLGTLYGKQHLASLLFTIPLALWLYSRHLDSGKWRDWVLCGVASGLVFLAHYNTIAVLAMMVVLEGAREIMTGKKLERAFLLVSSGILVCFITVTLGGNLSYGGKLFRYIKELHELMTANQKRVFSGFSDGYLLGFASWEGMAIPFYFVGCAWLARRVFLDQERRLLALALIPMLGIPLVFLRINAGFLSYPRLYVFALPFLWIGAGGFLASMAEKLFHGCSDRFNRSVALAVAIAAVFIGLAHHRMMARHPSANAALERYFNAHPTQKMVIWKGNPHLAAFLAGWNFCPAINVTREDADNWWQKSMGGINFERRLSPEVADPKNRVYLNRPDLSKVCDLIVLENFSINTLNYFDSKISQVAPRAFSANFYNGASGYLPIQADESDLLSAPPAFSPDHRLPLIRIYDLRGK